MTAFYLLAAMAVVTSLLVITQHNPMYSVLFLFVVMLLNAPKEDAEEARLRGIVAPGVRNLGAVLAIALIAELGWALTKNGGESGPFPGAAVTSVAAIGRLLFRDYAFPF